MTEDRSDAQPAEYRRVSKAVCILVICLIVLGLCFGACLIYKNTRPEADAEGETGDYEFPDLKEMVPLLLTSQEPAGMVVFSVPDDVEQSDIVTENLYNERMLLIRIATKSEYFYGSLSSSGFTVDTGRISGDSALVEEAGVVYDEAGAVLVFRMALIYEYELTMDGNTVTMEAHAPHDLYSGIVVMDAEDYVQAAGVSGEVAGRCARLLEENGIRVYLTDYDIPEKERVTITELMEETGADMYIRTGVSSDGEGRHGIRVWYDPLYYIPGFGSIELGECCLRNVAVSASNKAVGIFEAPRDSILYEIDAPAIYITLGNADDESESRLLADDLYIDRLAEGLYNGITESFNMMGDMKK